VCSHQIEIRLNPILGGKFTIWGEINAIYDIYLIYIIFLFEVLIYRAASTTSAPACITDLLFKIGARVSYHAPEQ